MKIMGTHVEFVNGIDIYINNKWYGIHFNWQCDPLFDIINCHRKCNTVHEYGIIIFGFWIYVKIDE
jgi:hypothetical protein